MGAEEPAPQMTKAQKKNAAKKRAKQAAREGANAEAPAEAAPAEPLNAPEGNTSAASTLGTEEKELRKLNKKLRELDKLQAAVDAVRMARANRRVRCCMWQGTTLDEAQQVKLSKRQDIQAQVDELQRALEAATI